MVNEEKQMLLDEEHLKLLRIGYIVAGISDLFFAFVPLIYVLMGILVAAFSGGQRRSGEPNPALFGLIFVVIGLVVSGFFAGAAALKLLAARALGQRQSRTLCLVAATLCCISLPWGTLLGVLSFLVLCRASVIKLFEGQTRVDAQPSEPVASSLFSEQGANR